MLLIPRGDLSPQGLRARAATLSHVEGKDLARVGSHGNPHPLGEQGNDALAYSRRAVASGSVTLDADNRIVCFQADGMRLPQ